MPKVAKSMVLPPAVGAYVSLFTPRDPPAGSNGGPRYSIVLLYPKATAEKVLAPLKAAVLATAVEKWGPQKGPQVVAKMRWPVIADGDERYPEDPTFKDMVFVRASTQADPKRRPPQVVDGRRQPVLDDEGAYSGCTFNVSVRLFPFDKAGNAGIGVGLNNAQVVKRGPRMDGRKNAEDEFEELPESAGGADELM